MTENAATQRGGLGELAAIFLRLGFTAFGGPAAHIALFQDEFVRRRGWLTEQHFLDMLAATNIIPGPNSTEMTMHIGYTRAGTAGLFVAGACFILPAALIVGVLAWLYAQYGQTPAAGWLLYGVQPVIIAIVGQAIWNLGRKIAAKPIPLIIMVAAFAAALIGVDEILITIVGALVGVIGLNWARLRGASLLLVPGDWMREAILRAPLMAQTAPAAEPVSLITLFLTFLKIGGVIYGSGYVLLSYLRTDFVERLGWLTDRQLLDAIAIGQFTPGPLFTSATFVGYQVAGVGGAIVSTLGIFLPGFIFVLITNPLIPRMRANPWLAGVLDGVSAAAVGLMAAVAIELARAALVDALTIVLAVVTLAILLRVKINATWLIVAGAAVGFAAKAIA